MKLRAVSIGISSGVLLGMAGLLRYFCYDGIINAVLGSLFFLLFCGTPQMVTIVLAVRSKNLFLHILLLTASLFYGAWFVYCLYIAAYDPSSTSALVLLVVGIAALPILIPLSLPSILRGRLRNAQGEITSTKDLEWRVFRGWRDFSRWSK